MSYADEVKARLLHSETILAGNKIYYRNKKNVAKNYGRVWTWSELEMILSDYRPTDRVLAIKLGRSMGAIAAMRHKIKTEYERR